MIPEWVIQQIMEDERSTESSISKRKDFAHLEADSASWMDMLIQSDIEKLEQVFPDVFKQNSKMANTINFLLWKSILRGWSMSEAKWKSNLLQLPGESSEKNPNNYTPVSEDFI